MKSKNKSTKDASPRKPEKKPSPRGKASSPAKVKDGATGGRNTFSASPLYRSISSQNSNLRPPLSPVTPPPPPTGQKDGNISHCENPDTKSEILKANPPPERHPPHFNIRSLVYKEAMSKGNYTPSTAGCSSSKYATGVIQLSAVVTPQVANAGYVKTEARDDAFASPGRYSSSQHRQSGVPSIEPSRKVIDLISSLSNSISAESPAYLSQNGTFSRSSQEIRTGVLQAPIMSLATNTAASSSSNGVPSLYNQYAAASVPLMMSALSCNVSPHTVSTSHTKHTSIQEQERSQMSKVTDSTGRDHVISDHVISQQKATKREIDDTKEAANKMKTSQEHVHSAKRSRPSHPTPPLTVHIPQKATPSFITTNSQSYAQSFSPVTPSDSEYSNLPAVPLQQFPTASVNTMDVRAQTDQSK